MGRHSRVAGVLAGIVVVAGLACQEEETVTAPALSATCEARPSSGPAPLAVSFLLGVSGGEGPFSVAVSYGDGASGTNPDAPHTYATAGSYTTSFTVATATQSARCSTPVTVHPGPSPSPSPEANRPPEAVFKSTPDAVRGTISGTAPLSVRFNMCLSSDPDGDKVYFMMDYDGNGKIDLAGTTGGNCRGEYVYAAGKWTAHNCLRDIDADGKALHDDQCKTYSVVATP